VLEDWIDEMETELPPLRNFILPSGGEPSSRLHIARSVCRRLERSLVFLLEAEELEAGTYSYVNRLSDFLFVLARLVAKRTGNSEVVYQKPKQK